MTDTYLGTLVSEDAALVNHNHRYLTTYLNVLVALHLPVVDSAEFLETVQANVQSRFGACLSLSFVSPFEGPVDDVAVNTPFHLLISLGESTFYSRSKH